MEVKNEMIGKTINSWTITGWEKSKPICQCQCGTVKTMQLSVLTEGKSKSCGCSSYFDIIGKKNWKAYSKKCLRNG